MKFFSWLGTILITLLIIAAITSPGDKKFENFVAEDKGGKTMDCKPIIGKSTQIKLLVKICSVHTVSYCELGKTKLKGIGNKTDNENTGISLTVPKITSTETYLGLFGKFWKI